jgi:hypothetical protein
MPVKLLVVLALLFTFASCYPDKKCSGELVFDDETALCYDCPTGSTFRDGTCECMPGYEFVGLQCVLKDGAMPPMPDAGEDTDGGETAYEGMGCKDYCAFVATCVGANTTAMSYLPDIISGLHADDAAACESKCKSDLGSNEATDPALKCIAEGAEGSMCTVADAQAGLTNTLTLIGQCCGPNASSPLCSSICAPFKANALTGSRVGAFCP